ncbi:MAG: hypothetical protein QM758_18025 [Armatimonas sp.]
MSLTISLPPEVEEKISAEAAREGVPAEELIRRTIEVRWPVAYPSSEAELLAQVNQGFPTVFWERYKALQPKVRDMRASEQERAEFLGMAEQLEQRQTTRLRALVALSQLRGEALEIIIIPLALSQRYDFRGPCAST